MDQTELKSGDAEYRGASGRTYVLNFGTNTLCRLEEETKLYHGDVIEKLVALNAPVSLARAWIWASLVDRSNLTIERAGEILDDLGGPYAIVVAFQLARLKQQLGKTSKAAATEARPV